MGEELQELMIEGVKITQLKVFTDERGSVRHMLKIADECFIKFGEIYFSTVRPGVVKAWHLHKKMTLNYACVYGSVMVGIIDLRPGASFGRQQFHVLNTKNNYFLLTIPPGVWNGFRVPLNVPQQEAMIANCATLPHDPDEIVRVHPDEFPIDFDWGEYEIAG